MLSSTDVAISVCPLRIYQLSFVDSFSVLDFRFLNLIMTSGITEAILFVDSDALHNHLQMSLLYYASTSIYEYMYSYRQPNEIVNLDINFLVQTKH